MSSGVKPDRKTPGVRQNGADKITRAEFDKIISEIRRELQETCRDVTENVRRELQTQFTRIAQMQQEIDGLKRQNGR